MRHPHSRSCVIALLLCALSAGCREREVTSYRIPKEKDPELPAANATAATAPAPAPVSAPAGNGAMAATAVPTASGAGLTWTAPANWVSKPASAMRKATYTVSGDAGETADLSITAFRDMGGELANINRWRGQLALPPLAEPDLATAVTRFEENGLRFTVVDLTATGASPQRILAAIVPAGGETWYFKLTGPAALVAREQAAFTAFLKTVRVPAATP